MSENSLPKASTMANRMANIAPFHVMEILAKAKQLSEQGRDIIRLEVGEPDFPTPDAIIRAGQQALAQGQTRYTPALGIPELRAAISHFYQQQLNVTVPPERIAVTTGASGALMLALAATTNPGDELLLPEPGYPCNRHFAELLDVKPVAVNTFPDHRYRLTETLLTEHLSEKTKGLLIASPANPTGALLSPTEESWIADFCRQYNLHWFMDEIYQGLTYDQAPNTVLARLAQEPKHNPHTWVIQSFSKYFQMTGWRLGWLVIPEGFENAVERLAQNLYLSAPTIAQYAALSAFEPEVIQLLEQRKQELKLRRDYLVPALEGIGIKVQADAQGAFYIYCDVSKFTQDAMGFCHSLLESEGVSVTPGEDFGGEGKHTSIRIAYTEDIPRLQLAIEKIKHFITKD
mgnify:FL=1